jgi:UPF0755 protein
MRNRTILLIVVILIAVGGTMAYNKVFKNNNVAVEKVVVTVPKNATFDQLLDSLRAHQVILDENTFKWTCQLRRFQTPRMGHYELREGMNNKDITTLLRQGQHYGVKFTFNNLRTKEQLVEKVDHRFFFAPEDFSALLNDNEFLANYGFDTATCIAAFIPDSYEFFYDITAEEFFEKMMSYYQRFWNDERKKQAEEIGLTPTEVAVLASIVEEENYKASEKAMIAGVYMNRLNKGMLLQADPTVKYAVGDPTLKRILLEHTTVDSPYNTYLYPGLPPAPIRIPEASTMDSVLHYTHHNYLYMCAKDDLSGYHNFATTLAEHNRNAAAYHRALNRLK